MPLLKKFSETGQEIGSEDVPVTPDNFQKLTEQYSPDFIKGYAAAVADLEKRIKKEAVMDSKYPEMFNSHHVAGRKIYEFYQRTLTPLLQSVTPFLPEPKKPDDLTMK